MGGRKIAVFGTAALMVGMLAAPASAHVWFKGDNWVPANSDQQLTLNVPEEDDYSSAHNSMVEARLPEGWKAVSCVPLAGWQCMAQSSPAAVKWTRKAGAPDVAQETFMFTVHTGNPDDYIYFPVIQTYANGEVVKWTDDSDGKCPAPAFAVYTPKHAPEPSPTVKPAPSPSVLGIQVGPRAPQVLPRTGTNAALPAAIGALLVAFGSGILLAGRRRRKPTA